MKKYLCVWVFKRPTPHSPTAGPQNQYINFENSNWKHLFMVFSSKSKSGTAAL